MFRRRDLLLGLPGLALACSGGKDQPSEPAPAPGPASGSAPPAKPVTADVIVIGAGVAGLAAAHDLVEAGKRVIVVEGRARIGGRLHTDRSWPNLPLELGATWIHGAKRNPITALATANSLRTRKTNWDRARVYDGSRELTDRERKRLARNLEKASKAVADVDGTDGPLGDALTKAVADLELDDNDRRAVEYRITAEIEQDVGTDIAAMSRKSWDEGAEERGEDLLFLDGYDGIFKGLTPKLDIRLEHKVTAIRHGKDVRVVTDRGELSAPHAIVTLPLGVLKAGKVAFDPPLPAANQTAIDRLGFGVLDKLYTRFDRAFWPDDAEILGRLAKKHGEFVTAVNLAVHWGEPVLMWLHAGSAARRAEGMTDRALVDGATAALREMFGDAAHEPKAWIATRWHADPFSLGSYSFLPPKATQLDRRTLGQPVNNRLFFAGEATEPDYPATIRGAYVSGRREAARILKL